ncbi:hypothetical protein ACFS07_34330 [Undibacterium arcticum]
MLKMYGFFPPEDTVFLAGEPLDEPTARWVSDGLGVPIIGNYWQAESGWPIFTIVNGIEKKSQQIRPLRSAHIRLRRKANAREDRIYPGRAQSKRAYPAIITSLK